MAEKLGEKALVSFKEMFMANCIQVDALCHFLGSPYFALSVTEGNQKATDLVTAPSAERHCRKRTMRSKAFQTECLRRTFEPVMKIADGLLAAPRHSAKRIETGSLPRSPGIYLWQLTKTGKIDYVGVALGRNGLRQRVGWQHLRPGYKKSVFRIKIAQHLALDVWQQCVEHIKSAYRFAYLFPTLNGVNNIFFLKPDRIT